MCTRDLAINVYRVVSHRVAGFPYCYLISGEEAYKNRDLLQEGSRKLRSLPRTETSNLAEFEYIQLRNSSTYNCTTHTTAGLFLMKSFLCSGACHINQSQYCVCVTSLNHEIEDIHTHTRTYTYTRARAVAQYTHTQSRDS